jgi:hypothetical protein
VGERVPTRDEWDEAARRANSPATSRRTYATATCPKCGRTIREGAYSGRRGNLDRHLDTCKQAR